MAFLRLIHRTAYFLLSLFTLLIGKIVNASHGQLLVKDGEGHLLTLPWRLVCLLIYCTLRPLFDRLWKLMVRIDPYGNFSQAVAWIGDDLEERED